MSEKMITDQDYLFLSAMVKAREAKMLTAEALERMISTANVEDAAKVLVDYGYDDMSGMSANEVEEVLSKRKAAIFREVSNLSPEKGTADAFRIRYDYHNAKVIIKARGNGVDGDHMLSDSGRVSPKVISEAYDTDDYRFIPNTLAHAMVESKGILARTNNPQLSDLCMDKAYFEELKKMSGAMAGSFMGNYVKALIDSANIRAAVRILRMGRGIEFMRTALIVGGNVSSERLATAAVNDGIADLFSFGVFTEAARLGAEAAQGGTMTAFEMACDNALTHFLKNAKFTSFGDAPVIAYLAAVEGEVTAVRMILTGKLAGVSPESLRERLRVSYV